MRGPAAGLAATKDALERELHMDLESALEAEARIQAALMRGPDFREGFAAFVRSAGRRGSRERPNEAPAPHRPTPSWRTGTCALADRVRAFGEQAPARDRRTTSRDPAARTREIVRGLAEAGLLAVRGARLRTAPWTCARWWWCASGLAYFSSLADTAFAMQGLGSYAVSRAGTEVQKKRWLPAVAARRACSRAFAVTEPEAGSDLAGVRTRADRDGRRSGGCAA